MRSPVGACIKSPLTLFIPFPTQLLSAKGEVKQSRCGAADASPPPPPFDPQVRQDAARFTWRDVAALALYLCLDFFFLFFVLPHAF